MRPGVGFNQALIYAAVFPQFAGNLVWFDANRVPPSLLVAGAMDRAMMDTAKRHGEFIAGRPSARGCK